MSPKQRWLACSLGVVCLRVPLPGQTWTESRVLELFSQQSPQALAARAQIAVTREELRGRALYANPSFVYSREAAGYTEFFQGEVALPLSRRIGLLRQSVAPGVAAAEADAAASVWQLRVEVRLAFYHLLAHQAREAVLDDAARQLQDVIRILEAREQEGEGSRYDRLRGQREQVELATEKTAARAEAARARSRLLEFLPAGTAVAGVEGVVEPAAPPPVLEELNAKALAARAEFRAAAQRFERLVLEEKAAERLRYPEPVVAAGLKRADAGARTLSGPVVGVTVPIPWFNRGQQEVARLQAERSQLEARRRALEHQVRAQVTGAHESLRLKTDNLAAYRGRLGESGDELLRIAQTAYQEGEAGILELLDALRLSRQSRLRRLELEMAVREAHIELDRVVGEEVSR